MITVNKANPTAGEVTSSLTSEAGGLYFSDGGTIDLTNSAGAEFGTSDFSLEFILNQTKDNTNDSYIYFSHISGNNRVRLVNATSSSNVKLQFINNSGATAEYVLSYDMSQDYGKPTHYILGADRSGNADLYKNGNSVASVDISGSSAVDLGSGNATVGRISSTAGYSILGTLSRFRTFNRLVDAKKLFENQNIDFSEQWGSQTSLVDAAASVFTSGTYGWVKYGNNTIANTSNQLVVTYVDNVQGAYNYLKDSTDLTTNLTVGKKYKVKIDAKYAGGSAGVKLRIANGVATTEFATLTTSLTTYEVEFTAQSATGCYINLGDMSASNVVTLDNFYVYTCGAVVDYDLSFSNPSQSLQIWDRSSNGITGTASATGVEQTQPIKQLNSRAMRVGTSVLNPASGAIVADSLGIGTASSFADSQAAIVGGDNVGLALQSTHSGKTSRIRFFDNSGNQDATVGFSNDNSTLFMGTGTNAHLRIDTNGNVVVDGGGYIQIGPTDSTAELYLYRNDTSIADGNAIGDINFGGADADNSVAARIRCKADGADWTASSSPTRLEFGTTPSGSETLATRLTIDSAGSIGVATTPKVCENIFVPVQVGSAASLVGRTAANQCRLGNNIYFHTSGAVKRINAGYAAQYVQNESGFHSFQYAGTDAADSAVTFVEAVQINDNGQVTVGVDADPSQTASCSMKITKGTAPSDVNGYSQLVLQRTDGHLNADGAQIMFNQAYHSGNTDYPAPVGAIRGYRTGPDTAYGGGLKLCYQPNSGAMGVTAGIVLDGAGNVGAGNTAPNGALEVSRGGASTESIISTWSAADVNHSVLSFKKSGSSTINTNAVTANGEPLGSINAYGVDTNSDQRRATRIEFNQAAAATGSKVAGSMVFKTSSTAANDVTRLTIDSTGLATFTGEITCTGLTISNQTNTTTGTRTSSKLDHYEEGTWTVGLGGASSVGNTTGYYTRIGDTVHVSYYSGSLTSDGSAATISGLPFTVNANVYGGFFTYHNTYCPTSSTGYFTVNTTVGYFTAENATATANTANASGRYIMFTGTYKV